MPSHPDAIDTRTPVDDIEPDEEAIYRAAYREASQIFTHLLNRAMNFVATATHPQIAAWQVAYAIGANVCEGVSLTERAAQLGVKKATLSKGAKIFQRGNGLPANQYMKDAASTASYADARTNQLK